MADDDITKGLAAAVDAAAVDDDGPEMAANQMPLFPSERLGELTGDKTERREQYEAPRGRGRPPGAKNRRTANWLDYLGSRYTPPLVTLAEMRCRPTLQLAEELGCSAKDAAALQVKCADIEAPYWHGKQPVDVRLQTNRPMLVMADPTAWLEKYQDEHPEGDTIDLNAVRVRMHEQEQDEAQAAQDVMEAVRTGASRGDFGKLADALMAEQGKNSDGTPERPGARLAHGEPNALISHGSEQFHTPRLGASDDAEDGR